MIFTEETMTEMRKRTALTQERDNFVAEANRTIANPNGRIAELNVFARHGRQAQGGS